MATTGVVGREWRADVSPAGSVEPWDGTPRLDWYVAADDRWHDPAMDAGVRHRRLDGTAVFETRVRIPGGDAVQRVWSVADHGGFTLVEVHNDSSLPVAVVFSRADVVTSRPSAGQPVASGQWGTDVPDGSVLLPVGHRSSVVVGLPHGPDRPPALSAGLPSPEAVVRGWMSRADAASRLDLPDAAQVHAVRAARCEALLCGPPDAAADPERSLLTIAELVRMNELDERSIGAAVEDVAIAVERVARGASPLRRPALDAAAVVLAAAGEQRALRDLGRLLRASTPDGGSHAHQEAGVGTGVDVIADVERSIAAGPVLFPGGIPRAWMGADFEAHGLVAGPASRLSLAVRWHGPNAAVLWEITGDQVSLSAPAVPGGWSSAGTSGDSLWVLDSRATRPSG